MTTVSTSRSHRAACALVLVAACSGGKADIELHVTRASMDTTSQLDVCDADNPQRACKTMVTVFHDANGGNARDVGLFIDDATANLKLRFQQASPNYCRELTVSVADHPKLTVGLGMVAGPLTTDCGGCPEQECQFSLPDAGPTP
jgi:hypothetical protein